MYELFMTAFIRDADVDKARAMLMGYCWSDSHHRFYRVFHYAATNPNQPRGIFKRDHIREKVPEPDPFLIGLPNVAPQPMNNNAEWRELNDILKTQAYIVTARYAVDRGDFGAPTALAPNHFDVNEGALFWTEIPDPASVSGNQRVILQRKKIEIWDQYNLPTVLSENDYAYRAESIEEHYEIYHREEPLLSFEFVRVHKLPPKPSGDKADPFAALPPLDALAKHDPAGKWMLWAKYHVLEDQSPDNIKAARERLGKLRDELVATGIEFKEIDRRFHDTQLLADKQPATRTLGQKQSVGGFSGGAR